MSDALAAYGVAFVGLGSSDSLEPPPSWPRWTLTQEIGPTDDAPGVDVWEDRARIGMPAIGEFRLERSAQRIVLRIQERWPPEAVLHPGLAPPASVVAHWMGNVTLHAAAVLIDGQIWSLVGDKGTGKSTMAAHLVGLGCALVTDDLLVVNGMEGFAGPGAVDLRGDVGPQLGGQPLGMIGGRERWRAAVRIGTLSAPLGGWVELCWSEDATTCDAIPASQRLQALDRYTVLPPGGAQLLRLGDLPMLQFSRCRATGRARADAVQILEQIQDGLRDALDSPANERSDGA